jgi:ATP-dependent helicase/nuclease subunit B
VLRIITSTSGAARLEAAERFLADRSPSAEVVIVGASRGAADDFARAIASRIGATFGLARFSLTELAARVGAAGLAGTQRVPSTRAGAEATAARAVFDAVAAGDLEYFAPVALMPGFPRALASTLHELRLASIGPERVAETGRSLAPEAGEGVPDLGRLLERV